MTDVLPDMQRAIAEALSHDVASAAQQCERALLELPGGRHPALAATLLKRVLHAFFSHHLDQNDGSSVFAKREGDQAALLDALLLASMRVARDGPARQRDDGDSGAAWRGLPAIVLVEVARLVPADNVAAAMAFLLRGGVAAGGYHDVLTAADVRQIGSILIRKLSESINADLIGKLTWWMGEHTAAIHKPALNISYVINSGHPMRMDEDAPAAVAGDASADAFDPEQYRLFWGFQASLYDGDVLHVPEKWAVCKQQLEVVLKACEGPVQVSSDTALQTCGQSTVAFLSSSSLLSMQLRDATFRRSVLVEALMLVHRGLTHDDLLPEGRPKPRQRMREDCAALRPRVVQALAATPSGGEGFAERMEAAMEAETMFLSWKRETPKNKLDARSKVSLQVDAADLASMQQQLDACEAESRAAADGVRKAVPPAEGRRLRLAEVLANAGDLSCTSRQGARDLQKDLELVVPSIGVVPAATSENGAKSEQHASESGEVAVPGKRKRDGSAAGSNPDSRRPSMTGQRPRLKSWQVLRRLARHDVKAFAEVATARLSDADVVQFAACAVVGSSDLPKPAKEWFEIMQQATKPAAKKVKGKGDAKHDAKLKGRDSSDVPGPSTALNVDAKPFDPKASGASRAAQQPARAAAEAPSRSASAKHASAQDAGKASATGKARTRGKPDAAVSSDPSAKSLGEEAPAGTAPVNGRAAARSAGEAAAQRQDAGDSGPERADPASKADDAQAQEGPAAAPDGGKRISAADATAAAVKRASPAALSRTAEGSKPKRARIEGPELDRARGTERTDRARAPAGVSLHDRSARFGDPAAEQRRSDDAEKLARVPSGKGAKEPRKGKESESRRR